MTKPRLTRNNMAEKINLIDKLETYGFSDKHGHPLEKCVDWQNLRSQIDNQIPKQEVLNILESSLVDIDCPGFGDHTTKCYILTEAKQALLTKIKE